MTSVLADIVRDLLVACLNGENVVDSGSLPPIWEEHLDI